MLLHGVRGNMDKLKTATGKEFDCDYFNPFPQAGQINVRILGENLVRVVTIFSDTQETVQMWFGSQYASGYTKVIAIVPEGDAVRVVLGKE